MAPRSAATSLPLNLSVSSPAATAQRTVSTEEFLETLRHSGDEDVVIQSVEDQEPETGSVAMEDVDVDEAPKEDAMELSLPVPETLEWKDSEEETEDQAEEMEVDKTEDLSEDLSEDADMEGEPVGYNADDEMTEGEMVAGHDASESEAEPSHDDAASDDGSIAGDEISEDEAYMSDSDSLPPPAGQPFAQLSLAPHAPSARERADFYIGLPSQPRLVARTDTQRMSSSHAQRRCHIAPPSGAAHAPLVAAWNATLLADLHEALADDPWTSIDLVLLGHGVGAAPPRAWQPVVWIGVEPGSLDWADALDLARDCQDLVAEHGFDVQCHVREASVDSAAGSRVVDAPEVGAPEPGFVPSRAVTHMPQLACQAHMLTSRFVGQPMCAVTSPGDEAALGFYVRSRESGRVYAVTSRRALLPGAVSSDSLSFDSSDSLSDSISAAEQPAVFFAAQNTFRNAWSQCPSRAVYLDRLSARHRDSKAHSQSSSSSADERYQARRQYKKYARHFHTLAAQPDTAHTLARPEQRVFGRVMPVEADETTTDIALVEVAAAADVRSAIPVRGAPAAMLNGEVSEFPGGELRMWTEVDGERMPSAVASMADSEGNMALQLDGPAADADADAEAGDSVWRYTWTAGLTRGRTSAAQSLVRVGDEARRVLAAVPQADPAARRRLDGVCSNWRENGAVVFGEGGRLVGLQTAAVGRGAGPADLVYVTAVEGVMEEIEAMVGEVEIV